jgi:hypothetical protein
VQKICIECAKDENLKKLIEKNGVIGRCGLCGENHVSLDYGDRDLFSLIKAVLRFNFSEWDYNIHWGGDGYESLFYGNDNIFFCNNRAKSEEDYDEFVSFIAAGPVYEDYDVGISLFAGYDEDGCQNMLLESIRSTTDPKIAKIATRLESENYFVVEAELQQILGNYTRISETTIDEGCAFYRARVGFEDRKRNLDGGFETEYHYTPYTQDKIGSPLPGIVGAGRANRPGVSFFYCATDLYTAISEIRPHPGDRVSIGKFTLQKDAKIFDLSESQLLHFYSSDKCLDSYIPLHTLSTLLNKVISPDERKQYSITQLIADCIRQLGFDGISFSSTVGDGTNFVFFEPSIISYTENEASVVEIKQVKYRFDNALLVSDDGLYDS